MKLIFIFYKESTMNTPDNNSSLRGRNSSIFTVDSPMFMHSTDIKDYTNTTKELSESKTEFDKALEGMNREQRRQFKKKAKKDNVLKHSLRNNKSYYELIQTYKDIKSFLDNLKNTYSKLSDIVKEEINHITIIEIKEQLLQHQATVKEAIEAADIQLELIYDKHKNKKRGMKDYDEYIEVMELYIEYQDMTVKYLEVVSVNIDRIKHILSTHVTDSDVHNIEETPEIKIGDYVEIASRVMDDKILIPEFLKNGETK